MKVDAHKRTLLKSISWRVISLVVTFVVTFTITGNTYVALSVSTLDTVIKLIIYYFHERAWLTVRWGRVKKPKRKKATKKSKHKGADVK